MSNFVDNAINKQYSATSISQAIHFYERSCNICITCGRRARCEHCSVANVHNSVIEYFNSKEEKKSADKCA